MSERPSEAAWGRGTLARARRSSLRLDPHRFAGVGAAFGGRLAEGIPLAEEGVRWFRAHPYTASRLRLGEEGLEHARVWGAGTSELHALVRLCRMGEVESAPLSGAKLDALRDLVASFSERLEPPVLAEARQLV